MKKTRILGALAFGAIVTLGVTLYATEQEQHPSALFRIDPPLLMRIDPPTC